MPVLCWRVLLQHAKIVVTRAVVLLSATHAQPAVAAATCYCHLGCTMRWVRAACECTVRACSGGVVSGQQLALFLVGVASAVGLSES